MVTVTKYIWDPVFDCVSHELDENNDVKAVYNNEPQQYGGVLSQRRGTTSHYHHYDALGSTRFLTDSSGNVTDTYLHDAWGNSVASTGTTVNPFKWVGKYGYYTDDTIAQVYVRARMYQPTVTKWSSVDPFWYFDGPNVYTYAHGSPTGEIDPSGKLTSTVVAPLVRAQCPDKGAKAHFQFTLQSKAHCRGFLIQKVSVSCRVGGCDETGKEDSFSYWEAWRVEEGDRIYKSGRKFTDTAFWDISDCTTGMYRQDGEVRFFCDAEVGVRERSSRIPGWEEKGGARVWYPNPNSPCRTTPGGLQSTGQQPAFWGTHGFVYGIAYRAFQVDWKCCPKEKPCCSDGSKSADTIPYWPDTLINE